MKTFLTLVLCLTAVLTMVGCQNKSTTPISTTGNSDTLIIGVPDTPPNVDYENGAGMVAQYMILDNVMAKGATWPLVQSTAPEMGFVSVPDFSDPSKLVPNLYESWEVSADNMTATYHLRKGVISAYGNKLTTKDILWKYQRHFALKAVGNFFMTVSDVNGPNGVNLKILDDYTFQLHSVAPNALAEYIMTSLYDTVWDSTEAKKHVTTNDPWASDWISRNGGGFAPYYITDWVANQQIVLKYNPNYWTGGPKIKTVIFKVIPESANRVAMLKKGEIDIATELAPSEIDSLKSATGIKIVNIPANTNDFLVMNEEMVKPFADVRVRQAVNYAIPKQDIVNTAYFGQAKPWNAVFTTLVPGALPNSEWMYDYNLDKAKALMVEAGYADGFDVELYYSADWTAHDAAAILIKDSLDKIGIRVALRKTPNGSFDTLVRSYKAPFAIEHEYPALPNGIFNMSLYYLSKGAGGAYGAFGYYNSKQADQEIIDGIRTPFAQQQSKSEAAQKTIMEDAPMGWIVESNYTAAIRDNIQGFNWDFAQGTLFNLMSK
jgi:peptide/nickel transport system substrate-binding protein